MRYYSTNRKSPDVTLREAVVKGLAPDRGLYMPEQIKRLPDSFFDNIGKMSFHEIACEVAAAFFGDDIPRGELDVIVRDTLSFPTPLVEVCPSVYALELFHGPTLAFKDVGARFMARLLRYFISRSDDRRQVHVLVATSGDTGSAVANGFLGVDGISVHVLYPKGKVSPIQECQFTTLGQNITAIEIDGVFDDCQRLVKSAFLDGELNRRLLLTSANSINVARFLPQAFYYFNAYAQLKRLGKADAPIVFSVPSGNFGNITAGLIACRMGLPVSRFIAANNANDVFFKYLQSGVYQPAPSIATIANAMDVGDPSNFARILYLYDNDHDTISTLISGATYSDGVIYKTMAECFADHGYILDPHGAVAYRALCRLMLPGENGVFLETAHPAKFKETVDKAIAPGSVEIPEKLAAFMNGSKQTVSLSSDYADFRNYLSNLD